MKTFRLKKSIPELSRGIDWFQTMQVCNETREKVGQFLLWGGMVRGKTLTPYNLHVEMPIHYKTSYWGIYATRNSNYILHTYSLCFQAWLPKWFWAKKRNKGIQAGKFWLIIDAISALRGVIRHGNGSGWLHRRKLSMTWLIKLEFRTHINAPPVYSTSGIIVLPFLSTSGLISKAKSRVTKAIKIIFSAR